MFACQGHTLIVEVGDQLTHYDVLQRDPLISWNFFGYTGTADSFGRLKEDNFDHANDAGWHYCIFGHQFENANYTTSTASGIAEVNGDDLLVSLGAFAGEVGTSFDRAATLAHEFGHNLGLGEEAQGNASAGDLILFSPATYDETNGLLLDKRLTIIGTGAAVFR